MKYFFSVFFILVATVFYSKAVFSQIGMNADSIIKVENNKRDALIGTAYPPFNVTLNNKIYSNRSLKGKTVFINFWFAACVPCMAEMDDLDKLFDKFKANKNFEFISFTFDNDSTIAAIKKKYNISYNIFTKSGEECHRLSFQGGFPTSIVIDTAGNIKYVSHLAEKADFVNTVYPVISKE
jgi:thiol-disulfide isomerase/thioredoxin